MLLHVLTVMLFTYDLKALCISPSSVLKGAGGANDDINAIDVYKPNLSDYECLGVLTKYCCLSLWVAFLIIIES